MKKMKNQKGTERDGFSVVLCYFLRANTHTHTEIYYMHLAAFLCTGVSRGSQPMVVV